MWTNLKGSQFYISYEHSEKYFNIFFTNFIKIWSSFYTESSLIECLLASNIGLEIESTELLNRGIEMLNSPEKTKTVKINEEGQVLNVTLNMAFGYPLYLIMKLDEGPTEMFFSMVTQPLLKCVKDLQSSENELRLILKAKDEEIEEYKMLGGKIRYTATSKFNEDEHLLKYAVCNQYFNDISNELIEKVVDVPVMPLKGDQKSNTVHIKTEPLSQQNEQPKSIEQNDITERIKTEHIKSENSDSLASNIPRKKKKSLLSI